VADAYRTLRDADSYAAYIAGGQELMLDIRHGEKSPTLLVDVSEIAPLTTITETEESFEIGACVTYRRLREHGSIETELPFFTAAVEDVGGPQVRNSGTLGGALCDADPVFDMPAVLLSLDASVRTRVGSERRTIPLTEFYRGERRTALGPNELLTTIVVPKLPDAAAGVYRSMTPRAGDSTVAGVAVRLDFDAGGRCETARIGLTNAGVVPTRAHAAESALVGTEVTAADVETAAAALLDDLDLAPSPLSSESYRRRVFERLTRAAIEEVRATATGGANE
jgi:carbon-monoxide dehydrogenase medium subunit